MALFLSQNQRQAGHTYSLTLTPAGMTMSKNRKKNYQGFSLCEVRIPHALAKGECSSSKGYEKNPQIVQNPTKSIFPMETFTKAGHTLDPFYTHSLMCVSQSGVPTAPGTLHKHSPKSCTPPSKPGYLQQPPLCRSEPASPQNKVVNLFLKRLTAAFLSSPKEPSFHN